MRALRGLVLLLLLGGLAAAGAAWWWLHRPMPLAAPSLELSIEPGMNPREIANAWVKAGVQVPARLLYESFRWSGRAKRIRAGSYEVEQGITPIQLLDTMVQGDEALEKVRFTEGWTLRQLRAELARAPHLKPASAGMTDTQLMQALGAPGLPAEGRFFPDTYVYSRGVSDLTVLRRALQTQQRKLDAAWAQRQPDLPLKSPEEMLILASIVEKETGLAADRRKVAAVFINRLRIGMPLQTDPTVIYGLGEAFDGNLKKIHLQTDGPYNTYRRGGLPPTPIALPGEASLRAVAQPEPIRALYFVARGDGGSVFSDNLADHNRAVNQFQRRGANPR